MSQSSLLVVDGTAVIYRAFFAIRELSTRDGRPTNAVFGFIRMLTQLKEQWKPTHEVVVFDGGSPDWRLSILPTYKAQRPPMPDGMRDQLSLVDEYLDAACVSRIRIARQEADDVMASLAVRAAAEGAIVRLVTSDKDMFQLVNDRVGIVSPSGKVEAMGPPEVYAKTGVRPDQIVDWLAMIGDTADNIPGVRGVGPKTAARLLAEFGTLEGLWDRLGDVPQEALRQKLAEGRELVERNRELVRLRTDVAIGSTWDETSVRTGQSARLLGFFEAMEFESMARRLREPDLFG